MNGASRGSLVHHAFVPPPRIGKYELDRPLGEGGAGAVYLGHDTVLGRSVALKLLHPQLVHDAEVLGRFRAEAEAMARLNHPNVVIVHDFVGERNDWAIVMELVEGGESLASLLGRTGRFAPERALALAMDVARGLHHAHERDIVHRDVKPANVLVVRDGELERAKVSDFGIARLLDGHARTREGNTLGTLYYMAPEQAADSRVDFRADLYALGITLHEMLTGAVPFPYDSAPRLIRAHLEEPPPPTGIDPEIDGLLASLLAKDPAHRPSSAREVAERCAALARIPLRPSGDPPASGPVSFAPAAFAPTTPHGAPSLPPTHARAASAPGSSAHSNTGPAQDNTLLIVIGILVFAGAIVLGGAMLACYACAT